VSVERLTFDCYGTLVDWEGGIGNAFVKAAAADGVELDPAQVVAAYMKVEPVVEAGPFRCYREILGETARQVAARLGWQLDGSRASFLADGLPDWPVFADTRPALERLRAAGLRLGILSNVDVDLLTGTLGRIGVDFDLLVTAEQVGSYKPAHGHFLEARRQIGDAGWLHAAQSYYHDVVPARELGIPVAWINRHGEAAHGDARPDREYRTLTDLADQLS
jgi:2-haloalkanoic acid dehalogenase type II